MAVLLDGKPRMTPSDKPLPAKPATPASAKDNGKKNRLAKALRQNLLRRKAAEAKPDKP